MVPSDETTRSTVSPVAMGLRLAVSARPSQPSTRPATTRSTIHSCCSPDVRGSREECKADGIEGLHCPIVAMSAAHPVRHGKLVMLRCASPGTLRRGTVLII